MTSETGVSKFVRTCLVTSDRPRCSKYSYFLVTLLAYRTCTTLKTHVREIHMLQRQEKNCFGGEIHFSDFKDFIVFEFAGTPPNE